MIALMGIIGAAMMAFGIGMNEMKDVCPRLEDKPAICAEIGGK